MPKKGYNLQKHAQQVGEGKNTKTALQFDNLHLSQTPSGNHPDGPASNGTRSPGQINNGSVDVPLSKLPPDRESPVVVTLTSSKGSQLNGAVGGDGEKTLEEEPAHRGCCGRQQRERKPAVGVLELFRYAGPLEILMMLMGTLAAMVTGCAQPVNTLLFGEIINVFIDNLAPANGSNTTYGQRIEEEVQPLLIYIVIVGVSALTSGYLAVSLWTWAGERQITKIRKRFFRGVMRQDIGWFDTHEVGELNSRFSDDMHKIHEGMGDKVAVFVQWCTTWVSAYIVAFIKGWKLTLVCAAFSPLLVIVAATIAKLLRTMVGKELKAYAKAGAVAEQALRAVRTVYAFQGQEKEQAKYEDSLTEAKKVGTRKGLVFGLGGGSFWAIIFVAFAVAFYYGVVLIQNEGFAPGSILVVFFGVLIGSMSLGHAFPNLESFSNARAAAVKVYEIIDLRPKIDVSSSAGKTLPSLKGVIEFKDIHFRYPARPEVQVLEGLNVTVSPGQTVALVGASGCGKSTTVQLLQRFYDPERGQVTIDGHNIQDLNLKWLRDQIGVVNQEPVLFAATIADNIRYGQPDVTQEQIETAAVEANAHDFIAKLPLGYDTLVGERGAQLSGGQKQRIAIARALVKNPRILLLDEATSALDHESEAVVQNALEKASEGRTTLVIAHRLSTIYNADKIVAISDGRKEEEGSHQQLMAHDGLYAQLVKLQIRAEEEDGEDAIDLEIVDEEDEGEEEEEEATDKATSPQTTLRSISTFSNKSGNRRISIRRKARGKKQLTDKEGETKEKEEKEAYPASFKRLLRLNSPEWLVVLVGTLMTIICGLSQPCFAFVISEFLKVFSLRDKEDQMDQAYLLMGIMLGVGVLLAFLRSSSGYCFGKAGAELTARMRSLTFRSMLKQDMSFFDDKDNQVGSLTTRLASDAALVQGATGSKVAAALEAMATLLAALTIAFVYGWKLTFVILAFLPIMIAAGKVQGRVIAGSAKSEKSQLQEAGKICSEAVDNIRTVASLNREDIFIDKLDQLLNATTRSSTRMAQLFGLTYGLSVSIQYFAIAAAFAYGSSLVVVGEMQFFHVFRVFSAIIMGGSSVGRNSSFGVDYTKAKLAAGRLFAIIDKIPKIDINKQGGSKLEQYNGRVGLDKVVFHYPTRNTVQVLSGLSLGVEPGQTLALVGSSGCGKSTVLQLLQRFYDTDSGALLIDGHDLKTLDLRWFRQQLGIVSQEPTLFDDSIAANIAYGDNTRQVSMDEIITAARNANIHTFIESLPQGYDTNVGDKGTQLSGGQKQRIAIARALVRRPKVLLLDEATSALDTESERVVQEALDKAREGRTCIVIAHRLTTIQNADRIAVIKEGRLEEVGSHVELLAREGVYFGLLQSQHALKRASLAVGTLDG